MNDMFVTIQQQPSGGGGILGLVSSLGVIIGFITFYIGHRFSRNKFRHELTLKCIERYQEIVKQDELKQADVNLYLGFLNEELYYIQHGLVDRKMGQEWLANIINYLPILVDNGAEIRAINLKLLEKTGSIFANRKEWNRLFRYTRIRKAIYIKGKAEDYEFTYERDFLKGYKHMQYNQVIRHRIVCQMLLNLESDCWYRYLYRSLCNKISHYIYRKTISIRYGKLDKAISKTQNIADTKYA